MGASHKGSASAKLAQFRCPDCKRVFEDGRQLGGHIRQRHLAEARRRAGPAVSEGELAARILEGWRAGKTPLKLIVALRVHPRSVREVIEAYAELLTTWKQYSVATTSSDTAPASTLARFLPAIEDAEQFGRDLDRRPSKSGADRDATR